MARVTILDGYVDEPAQFGVPPYVSPQARYLFGAARAAGIEANDITYLTIDAARTRRQGLQDAARTDVFVVLASCVVPGKYLRGRPITRDEAHRAFTAAKRHDAFTMLAGASARFGFGDAGGGHAAREVTPLKRMVDRLSPDHSDALLHDTLVARASGLEPPGPFGQRKRTPEEWERFALLGAELAPQHPDHPEPLIAEIDTYTGCARYVDGGCAFCMEPLEGRPRYRPVDGIVDEVRRLYELGVRSFRLGGQACFYSYDAHGVGVEPDPKPNVDAIGRLLRGVRDAAPEPRVLHIDNSNPAVIAKWEDEARAVTRLLVEHMTDGNVGAFGLESMDPAVQAANNLNHSPESAFLATRIVNEEGGHIGPNGQPWMLPGFNFISGLPGETKTTNGHNLRFLKTVFDAGLKVRRVNVRQIMPARKGMEPLPRKKHHDFVSFKRKVREDFDHPMLARCFPVGSVLRDVYTEKMDGNTTFGRPLGSYPILVGIPYPVPLDSFVDVVVTSHGQRSITGFVTPFPVADADLRMWQALPGIGKKRALELKMDPPTDHGGFAQRVGDPAIDAALTPHMSFASG